MPVHHPNKQKNPVEALRAWKPNLHGRALKACLKRERRRLRLRQKHDPHAFLGPPKKPVTSTTPGRGRNYRVTRMPAGFVDPQGRGSNAMVTYTTADHGGFVGGRPVPCPCDACALDRARVRKERPAKDVKAAKLREYRSKRDAVVDG